VEIRRRHADDTLTGHDFGDKLRAALPLWKDVKAVGKLTDVVMKAPFGQAKLSSLGETIGFSGLTAPATAEFGIDLEG